MRSFHRLVLLIACAFVLVQAAAAQVTFSRNYDRPDREYSPRDQLELPGGGYLICGDAYVTGTQRSRPYLMRLDAAGGVQWCKEYPFFDGFHRAEAILPFAPNLYVLLGDFYGVQKPALMAVDGSGNLLIAAGYLQGPDPLTMEDFTRTSDGGFLLVGSTFHAATGQDLVVLKLGPFGQVLWYRELAGSIAYPLFGADDFGVTAVEAADGSGYFVGGSLESDAFLAKLDLGGDVVFQRTYKLAGAFRFERALAFLERPAGSSYLIAVADLSNDRFPLILEVDAGGNLLNTTVDSLPLSATKAIPTADGGFAIAGSSLITPGAQGLRLAKYDANASLQWARQYDVNLTFATINPPANVIQTADGGFLLSVAALSGIDPVQRVVKVDANGMLGCGSTALSGPFTFPVEASVPAPAAVTAPFFTPFLGAAATDVLAAASEDCPALD